MNTKLVAFKLLLRYGTFNLALLIEAGLVIVLVYAFMQPDVELGEGLAALIGVMVGVLGTALTVMVKDLYNPNDANGNGRPT